MFLCNILCGSLVKFIRVDVVILRCELCSLNESLPM